MIVVRDTKTLEGKRLVATIGFFDGVHLGHRFLIHELRQVTEAAGLPSAAARGSWSYHWSDAFVPSV